ncbi:MAG: hypothetical protein WC511_02935 [Candidatus Pacearchaeota archaeon]
MIKKYSFLKNSGWVKIFEDWEYEPSSELDVAFSEYETIRDSYLESFIEENKEEILFKLQNKYGFLPFKNFKALAVKENSLQGNVAKYLVGTYSEPRIVIDMAKHGVNEFEIKASLLHELSHAIQESKEEDLNENDAEDINYD